MQKSRDAWLVPECVSDMVRADHAQFHILHAAPKFFVRGILDFLR